MTTAAQPLTVPALAPAGTVPWTPREQAERTMNTFLSPVVGIVRSLYDRLHDTDDVYAYSIAADACNSKVLIDVACNKSNGGAGPDPDGARLSAIGETVERYSGAFVPFDQLRHGTYAELTADGLTCLSPEEYQPFARWQYEHPQVPFQPYTADTRMHWTASLRLGDGERVWLPAQAVYLCENLLRDPPLTYPTSNGLAYGSTTDEALVGGILELLERDGVMVTWYKRLSLPLVDVESDPELAAFFRRHVWPSGMHVSIVDVSRFAGVAAVLAVVRNRNTDFAPLGLGAAAAADPRRAVTKAVCEAVSTRGWAFLKQRDGDVPDPDSDFYRTITAFEDHVGLYANPSLVAETEFLDASSERVAVADLPRLPDGNPGELRDALIERATAGGVNLYAVDATSPDVREAGGHVVKVFSPQLQPLDAGYAGRHLGGDRLHGRLVEQGHIDPADADYVNPLPHPFP
ncbi:YcaO-like family protein [Amycolatopsis suaedae]|uniref:YcaO domain-containing protein n=1 Tax=Amycolatopsis suaedae TaxID=2510978 RepID=A0A4Q7J6P8_9PSEU|nr:YcaO-like family protein [Amycolatopsis suaedae]RZQ62516.1 hypothetical protein EWH70_19910 [Amycolatopsis suaedae]